MIFLVKHLVVAVVHRRTADIAELAIKPGGATMGASSSNRLLKYSLAKPVGSTSHVE